MSWNAHHELVASVPREQLDQSERTDSTLRRIQDVYRLKSGFDELPVQYIVTMFFDSLDHFLS